MAVKQATLFDLFDSAPEYKPDEGESVEKVSEVQGIQKFEDVKEVEEVEEVKRDLDIANSLEEETIEEELDEKLLEKDYTTSTYILEDATPEPMVEFSIVTEAHSKVSKEKSKVNERKSTRGRMKLSDMDAVVDLIEVPEDSVLFEKRYYSIGTVSEMFKVNISLIRFWENEFDILKPKKNGKGDRHFRPEDIKNLQLIYHLLREKKYTIEGAKDFLKKNKKSEETFAVIESLKKMKSFLNELKAGL